MRDILIIGAVVLGGLGLLPFIVSTFLRDVEAGTIRLVSWLQGSTAIYRGPGKSKEIPLLTTGTTISSKVINVDLDITDQTADVDDSGVPRPIKIRVLASAIVSVGDTDTMIKTAANRYFAKPMADQLNTLTDLLSSSGRRAINLLTHDQLFSAKSAPKIKSSLPVPVSVPTTAIQIAESEDDDPLSIIIRKACSRELTDLGLGFNSLNLKGVHSREAGLAAPQTRQARADAERVKIEAQAKAEAEAIRIRTVAQATAEAIAKVNDAIRQGGESYFKYRQIEMLPDIAPVIADALAKARMVTISGGENGGAANSAANNITSVIQTVLAAQLVSKAGLLPEPEPKP